MKIFNWFKSNQMPRMKAETRELFDVVGMEDTSEWQTIEACHANCEASSPEAIYAAYRVFLASKAAYKQQLMHEAFSIREEIVLNTVTLISGEGGDDESFKS